MEAAGVIIICLLRATIQHWIVATEDGTSIIRVYCTGSFMKKLEVAETGDMKWIRFEETDGDNSNKLGYSKYTYGCN